MNSYVGLTWDNPRGRAALEAASRNLPTGLCIDWHVQPLEGFESTPIERTARQYDLLVLDHPHLGDALGRSCLRPMDELIEPTDMSGWAAQTVGPSFDSYSMNGAQWALPLDVATQVAARRADLLDAPPHDWDGVRKLAREAPVALSLAGPHAFLTLCSIAVAHGEEPRTDGSSQLLSPATSHLALDLMRDIGARAPEGADRLNPIALLTRMSELDDVAYCPLVYGYVNFSQRDAGRRIAFSEAPSASGGARRGSTLGGTGIAVTRKAEVTPPLIEHLSWLMSPDAQERFIPQHAGQPSSRAAWLSPAINIDAADFYRNTISTVEQSWVRPRFAGYIPFQSAASEIVRSVVRGLRSVEEGVADLQWCYGAYAPNAD